MANREILRAIVIIDLSAPIDMGDNGWPIEDCQKIV